MFLFLTTGLATAATVDFPLLEASGAAKGVLLVPGSFAPNTYGALLQAGGSVLLLGGPTPHVVDNRTWAHDGVPIAGTADAHGALCLVTQDGGDGRHLACSTLKQPPAATNTLAVDGAVAVAALGPASLVVLSSPTPSEPDAAKPFKLVVTDAAGSLRVASETDLGVPARPGYAWRSLGVGELDGATALAAVRSSVDGSSLEIFLFAMHVGSGATPTPTPTLRASATLSASVPLPVIGVELADVYADGAPHLLIAYADSTVDVLWLSAGADALHRAASFRLDPAGPSSRWLGFSAGAWLNSSLALPNEAQLLGLRASPPPASPLPMDAAATAAASSFHATLLLFGRPEHWLRRRASVSGVRAMQEFKTSFRDNGPNVDNLTAPLDAGQMRRILASVNANTYSYSVCDCATSDRVWSCSPLYGYAQFVQFLEATKDFKVGGQQLRVWLGLYPPSEALPTGCTPPPDSPLTPFNESRLWEEEGGGAAGKYTSYTLWGDLAGRLAQLYPHLVAVDIDDFSSNVLSGTFDGNYVARITSSMRAHAAHLALSSVLYSNFSHFPDLALMLDAPVFFFRNALEGAQTCAPQACPWGPHARSHSGSCLAGVCSEPTTFNAPLEVAQVVAGMPPSRAIIAGYYATGHSSSGQPTARYVSRLLQTLAVQDRVGGVMTYCAKAALQPCEGAPLFGDNTNATLQHSLGCIVQRAYRLMA